MDYDFIIRVDLEPGDIRVCDYCNVILIDEKAEAVKPCHCTEYGLVCDKCLGSISPIRSYAVGRNVSKE